MSHTDLRQPDLGPLRAAAEAAEFAQAASGLVSADGYRLAAATRWRRSPATSPARSPRRA